MRFQEGRSVLFCLIFCLLAVFCVPPSYSSDLAPGPSTLDVATLEATRRFGDQSTAHFLKTFYDHAGAPAVHLFLVTDNRQSIPEDLEESIEEASRLREDAESLIESGHTGEGEELLARSKTLLLQEDRFGTLLVSARPDEPSLIAFHHGLPTYLVARTDAEERAGVFSEGQEVTPLGVLFFSPLEYYYEFEIQDEQILLSPFDSRVIYRVDLEEAPESFDPPASEAHGEHASHRAPATPPDFQEEDHAGTSDPISMSSQSSIIPGVPDYDQRPFLPNSCGPTAAACLLGYYDAQGYEDFLQGAGTYDDVTHLIEDLCEAMGWNPSTGVYYSQVPPGLRQIVDDRGYTFNISSLYRISSLGTVKNEIDANRPFVYGSQENPWGLGHYVVVVGYQENFIVVHDNWWSTPVDYFVSWDALGHNNDIMTTLIPQGQAGPPSQGLPTGLGGGGGGCFISTATQPYKEGSLSHLAICLFSGPKA